MPYLEFKGFTRHRLWVNRVGKEISSSGNQVGSWYPFATYLGREKTVQRILKWFYSTTLFRDVKQYCQTCEECQIQGGQRAKVPMTPLPIIGEPFRRISMDIVGPLPRTRQGHRFILVLSDYAIRYPEAMPLRTISASNVAEVLIDFFARHGIPYEILTDQGTNFKSSLLGDLYWFMGIKAMMTSPYHPTRMDLWNASIGFWRQCWGKYWKERSEIGIICYRTYCSPTMNSPKLQ